MALPQHDSGSIQQDIMRPTLVLVYEDVPFDCIGNSRLVSLDSGLW
jgi:hypothetical protein